MWLQYQLRHEPNFPALHWKRASQHGCVPRSSNSKPKNKKVLLLKTIEKKKKEKKKGRKIKYSFCIEIDTTTKPNEQMEIFSRFPHIPRLRLGFPLNKQGGCGCREVSLSVGTAPVEQRQRPWKRKLRFAPVDG